MKKELKAKIPNIQKLESNLETIGASFIKGLEVIDTYYNQPKGQVLKYVQDSNGHRIVELKSFDGGFKILDKNENPDKTKLVELEKKFGIYKVLTKKRLIYSKNELTIDINMIEKLGNFLVLTSENPTYEDMQKVLNIDRPHYITIPFCDL